MPLGLLVSRSFYFIFCYASYSKNHISLTAMEANFNIEAGLLSNENQFEEDFFKRFNLRKAPEPLQLSDTISKHYSFPTFYNDVTCAIAIYFCNYKKAQELMPHHSMKPVPATRGRAVVNFVLLSIQKRCTMLDHTMKSP